MKEEKEMNKFSFTLDVDKELKAGRLTTGLIDARKSRLKIYSAKEMFEELDLIQIKDNNEYLTYQDKYNEDLEIEFYKKYKVVNVNQTYDYSFDMECLKAINKQIEELGW